MFKKFFDGVGTFFADIMEPTPVPNRLGRMTPEQTFVEGVDSGTRIVADRVIHWVRTGNRPWMGFQPGPELDLAIAIEEALQKARKGDASQHYDPVVSPGTVRPDQVPLGEGQG